MYLEKGNHATKQFISIDLSKRFSIGDSQMNKDNNGLTYLKGFIKKIDK